MVRISDILKKAKEKKEERHLPEISKHEVPQQPAKSEVMKEAVLPETKDTKVEKPKIEQQPEAKEQKEDRPKVSRIRISPVVMKETRWYFDEMKKFERQKLR